MKPRYQTFEAKSFVGIKIELPHDISVSDRTWAILELRGKANQPNFGIILPGETTIEYVAANEAEIGAEAPNGLFLTEIPSGKFAIFTHQGSLDSVQETFDGIFSEWLPESGVELRDEAMLEIYRDSEIDIALPIE
jgi:predicted transcriptional regulator YdeE